MASATKELGTSRTIHARVLFGNEQLPPQIEIDPVTMFEPKLNKYQSDSVVAGLSNYLSLIQGPPGTGKTMVSSELALQHIRRGRRVLMVAKTNKAADMMISSLVKHIQNTGVPKESLNNIIRLGVKEKISPGLHEYTLEARMEKHNKYSEMQELEKRKDNCFMKIGAANDDIRKADEFIKSKPTLAVLRIPLAEFKKSKLLLEASETEKEIIDLNTREYRLAREITEDIIRDSQVIVATVYQCPRLELSNIEFDAVILDEASQATVPEAAMALVKLKADGFLCLIGDHKQLGPVVISDHKMLELSIYDLLMKRIIESQQQPAREKAMITLKKQYRMHPEIADICRKIAYPEGLEDAEIDVNLKINSFEPENSWFGQVLDSEKPVVFVSTGQISFDETKTESCSYINKRNADIIESIITKFKEAGVLPGQISVISSYKGQKELLRNRLKFCAVGTVDSFQGDESDVVIFDITRDNSAGRIGFLNNPKRLNVAVSRARKKLVIVGNHYNLKNVTDSVFKNFFDEISKNIIVVPLVEQKFQTHCATSID
jgi:superfamily I DNA and/or RNA helicase